MKQCRNENYEINSYSALLYVLLTVHGNCNVMRIFAKAVKSFTAVFALIRHPTFRNGEDLLIVTKMISWPCLELNFLIILVPFYIKWFITYEITIQIHFFVNIEIFIWIGCVVKCRWIGCCNKKTLQYWVYRACSMTFSWLQSTSINPFRVALMQLNWNYYSFIHIYYIHFESCMI